MLVLLFLLLLTPMAMAQERATPQQLQAILDYIDRNWTVLERSHEHLLKAAEDPKLKGKYPVYVSRNENLEAIRAQLARQLKPEAMALLDFRVLPEGGYEAITEHGLLYLPYPYVVPGGRFNEMYGWDSYFINLGLLRDGRVEQARHMVENHLYQIEHYGQVLNANRTYFLTRSQPPFLPAMVLDVYRRTGDRVWLESTLPGIRSYYKLWVTEPHLVPGTGLSRYYDFGKGPAPEVEQGERDETGANHYQRIARAYEERKATWNEEDYPLELYYKDGQLTELFYLGDRAMRESGYDPSDRFGPFNVDVIHYLPVDLNCLLYRYELDAAEICGYLGLSKEAGEWVERAKQRRSRILHYCWDEESGLFLDYNFRTQKRRNYPFGTAFFPLWVRLATSEQALRTAGNLKLFERPGGLLTSPHVSGNQWDAPYGWAPLELVAVEGLYHYGQDEAAERISIAFLSLILKEFIKTGGILEKYDVERRSSAVSLKYGYTTNEIGFGWTNAVFTRLYDELPERRRKEILKL